MRGHYSLSTIYFTFFFSPYFPLHLPSSSQFYVSHLFSRLSAFVLVFFSISRCTPTCSDIDCYARRIAPYTLTLCCKSNIESTEVFLREARIISEFGFSLCCMGTRPVQFHCCFAVAPCFGRIQERRLAGRKDYSRNTQTTCLWIGRKRTGISIKSAFSCPCFCWRTEVLMCLLQNWLYKIKSGPF